MEEAEKLLGRKLKPQEKFLIEQLYNENIYTIGVDSKGELILNKKE